MITCKSVSNALARGDYDKLPPLRKKMLKLHIKMCAMCGPYNGFVTEMQDTARSYCEHEEASGEKMPADMAERLKLAAATGERATASTTD